MGWEGRREGRSKRSSRKRSRAWSAPHSTGTAPRRAPATPRQPRPSATTSLRNCSSSTCSSDTLLISTSSQLRSTPPFRFRTLPLSRLALLLRPAAGRAISLPRPSPSSPSHFYAQAQVQLAHLSLFQPHDSSQSATSSQPTPHHFRSAFSSPRPFVHQPTLSQFNSDPHALLAIDVLEHISDEKHEDWVNRAVSGRSSGSLRPGPH